MADPRILIVGCGFPQLSLLRAAKALGLFVIGVDGNPNAIGAGVCDQFVERSTHDVDAVAEIAKDLRADGLTTCGSELSLRTAALAAEILGLPFYADSTTVDRCQAKDRMREAYQREGAPSPAFRLIATPGEAKAFASEHGLPLVVKPSRGWGQRGVSKVELPDELLPSFERAREASSTGVVVIEQFIPGKEYSVNAYTLEGKTEVLSVTERIITLYPDPPGITFAEWYPSGLTTEFERQVIDAALAGVRALGIRRGPSYTQLRLGERGAFIVETAHRLGGGLDPDVALLASGISLFRKILGVALGDTSWERCSAEAPRHSGAIGKFLVGTPGVVTDVSGLSDVRAAPGVIGAEVYVGIGDRVHPLVDGSKRIGHVLAIGNSRQDAESNASRAAHLLRIHTRTS